MERVFTEVNNGVYRCGFAGSQEAYDEAYDRLWTALDWLEDRLADRRYLMGDAITEADVRLFTTLARFDAVYHGHFKCNRNKLTEMPALWGYARDLFQTPGLRRDDRLRPDQGALLRRAQRHQPVRDRPEGAGPVRLGRPGRAAAGLEGGTPTEGAVVPVGVHLALGLAVRPARFGGVHAAPGATAAPPGQGEAHDDDCQHDPPEHWDPRFDEWLRQYSCPSRSGRHSAVGVVLRQWRDRCGVRSRRKRHGP